MRIRRIELKRLPPFRPELTLQFPEVERPAGTAQVYLFTGSNGTGKSRLLSVLAASLKGKGNLQSSRFDAKLVTRLQPTAGRTSQVQIFEEGAAREMAVVGVENHKPDGFLGFAYGAHRGLRNSDLQIMAGSGIPSVEARLSFERGDAQSLNQRIANLKVQAAMEAMNTGTPDGRWATVTSTIESAVSEITGQDFRIVATAHPKPSLLFRWGSRTLPITGLPDGLNAVLGWMLDAATALDLFHHEAPRPLEEPCFFFLDEPENHLHPQWQRKILPLGQRIFPNAQFFVATHSPFVVSSLNNGYIYKFLQSDDGVTLGECVVASKGDSYVHALSEILGVTELFDVETEKLLVAFRDARNAVMHGDVARAPEARELAAQVATRSQELANLMAMELRQFERFANEPQ